MNTSLPYLLPSDFELLKERGRLLRCLRLDTLVHESAPVSALYVVMAGALRVERILKGQPIAIARLGAGDIFGEMSFLEALPASAGVTAEEDSEILVVPHEVLRSLLETVPGLNARFYQSLASVLSRRLRETTQTAARVQVQEMARVNWFHSSRTGHVTERQLPAGIVAAMEQWQRDMWNVRLGLRERRLAEAEVRMRVKAAGDEVSRLLDSFTNDAELLESALSDPLSFRGGDDIASGIGSYLFRETFSTLMTSTTLARCYMKPLGYPDDHVTMARIYDGQPDGDGQIGVLVDEWFLQRPVCVSRRETQKLVALELRQALRGRSSGGVTSLACGHGGELLALLADPGASGVVATAVDLNEEAMLALAERAREQGLGGRVNLAQANVLRSMPNLPRQVAVGAHGLFDYLEDAKAAEFLDAVWRLLEPGGTAVVSNLAAANPDRLFMEHILDWKAIHRTEKELGELAARSRFARFERVASDPTGASLIGVAVKRA